MGGMNLIEEIQLMEKEEENKCLSYNLDRITKKSEDLYELGDIGQKALQDISTDSANESSNLRLTYPSAPNTQMRILKLPIEQSYVQNESDNLIQETHLIPLGGKNAILQNTDTHDVEEDEIEVFDARSFNKQKKHKRKSKGIRVEASRLNSYQERRGILKRKQKRKDYNVRISFDQIPSPGSYAIYNDLLPPTGDILGPLKGKHVRSIS